MTSRRPVLEKLCAVCGRRMEWRRKWARSWERVRYCSGHCRSRGLDPLDTRLEEALLALLESRASSASVCPSEVARAVDPDGWRRLMERAREAARRLAAREAVAFRQRGRTVDPSRARGAVRLARGPRWGRPGEVGP